MRYLFIALALIISLQMHGQPQPPTSPCLTDATYRQFDFWLGEWAAFSVKGKKAGDSKISLILDSCIILEEWTSVSPPGMPTFKGKSFNTYNATTKQWQQTWVNNTGGSTHYVFGKFENNKIIFQTSPDKTVNDTNVIMKLSFFNLGPDKVRQHGEISNDNGKTWSTQYDLEYRRKN